MAILPNPIANLEDGRLVKLHCGTPGERCNLDDAEDKKTATWEEAIWLLHNRIEYTGELLVLCQFCFGGEGE